LNVQSPIDPVRRPIPGIFAMSIWHGCRAL
jgi:hypothetical protein